MVEKLNEIVIKNVDSEFENLSEKQIRKVLELLADGNTIPFIARYRKEMTGSLDEVEIKQIEDRYTYLENLETRKGEVRKLIDDQGKLSEVLEQSIAAATKLQQVEDLYRPYKQKKKTKAVIARERGLEPFASFILECRLVQDLDKEAEAYVNPELSIESVTDVFEGAHEIIAEIVSDRADFREWVRKYIRVNGILASEVKDETLDERQVYEMYYSFQQSLSSLASHRILAINRAEREGVIKVSLSVNDLEITRFMSNRMIAQPASSSAVLIENAVSESYKRFIKPSIEREIRNELTEKAEEQAILIFSDNLKHLLLQAPIKDKVVLGFDPAYRTGCKLAIVDPFGKVLAIDVIYPHDPASKAQKEAAHHKFSRLLNTYKVDLVAIGNGTASRESEEFVASLIKEADHRVDYIIVSEAGASVYSASSVAREEFPDLQVEQRSAVSIARRLQDPLAELVKIEPKAVGVGQYQHDVNQKMLEGTLDFVVETAVNQVGVNINSASVQLLEHVAGLTKVLAKNIYAYRLENGQFKSKMELKKVARLGEKAFQQAVGFLRIPESKDILDHTGVHPEQYPLAKALLKLAGQNYTRQDLEHALARQDLSAYSYGQQTINDVLDGLMQPGRDVRDQMAAPLLRQDVLTIEDIKSGMKLQGTVRNVVDFGAFVDIGVKQDGLVHLSKLRKQFVKHPSEVVSLGDIVDVWVIGVDPKKKRIQLSMIQPSEDR